MPLPERDRHDARAQRDQVRRPRVARQAPGEPRPPPHVPVEPRQRPRNRRRYLRHDPTRTDYEAVPRNEQAHPTDRPRTADARSPDE